MSTSQPVKEMLLALNCGSSSIKFKLFALSDLTVLISGSASQVDSKGQKPIIKLTVHHPGSNGPDETESEEEQEGMEYRTRARDVIKLVAHRVVHGGSETEPMAIWPGHEEGLEKLDQLSEFAPLHNHRAVQVVKSCLEHLPSSKQILLFDTLFHQSLPEHIYTYPLKAPASPPPIPLRKYGAHGLSYASVVSSLSKHLQKPASQLNLVIAHLGSGASVCAVRDGKSYDTSMGLTPLDGLPGGSRSGSVDPVLVFHHTPSASESVDFKGVHLSRGEMLLNKEAGLSALAGTSDFRTIALRALSSSSDTGTDEERKAAKLTYNLFTDRIVNYVSAYVVKLLGAPGSSASQLDGIVFSGGIGEKSVELRRDVLAYFHWIGVEVDESANKSAGKDDTKVVFEITKATSKVKAFMCLTDEETQCAQMAKDAVASS
ncbi:acetate kinase [Clavulina sp. PMI_390]|nr:acetate kinase [Clavulina sp. PMI_390]